LQAKREGAAQTRQLKRLQGDREKCDEHVEVLHAELREVVLAESEESAAFSSRTARAAVEEINCCLNLEVDQQRRDVELLRSELTIRDRRVDELQRVRERLTSEAHQDVWAGQPEAQRSSQLSRNDGEPSAFATLKAEAAAARSASSSRDQKIRDLSAEVSAKLDEVGALMEDNTRKTAQADVLQDELDSLRKSIARAGGLGALLKISVSSASDIAVPSALQNNARLKMQEFDIGTPASENKFIMQPSILEVDAGRLHQENVCLGLDNVRLQSESTNFAHEESRMSKELAALRSEVLELREQASKTTSDIHSCSRDTGQLRAFEQDLDRAKSRGKEAERRRESAICEHEEERAALQTAAEARRRRVHELEAENAKMQGLNARQAADLSQLTERFTALRRNGATSGLVSSIQAQPQQAPGVSSHLHDELTDLRASLTNKEAQMGDLEADCAVQVQRLRDEFDALHMQQAPEARGEIAWLSEELTALQDTLDERDHGLSELEEISCVQAHQREHLHGERISAIDTELRVECDTAECLRTELENSIAETDTLRAGRRIGPALACNSVVASFGGTGKPMEASNLSPAASGPGSLFAQVVELRAKLAAQEGEVDRLTRQVAIGPTMLAGSPLPSRVLDSPSRWICHVEQVEEAAETVIARQVEELAERDAWLAMRSSHVADLQGDALRLRDAGCVRDRLIGQLRQEIATQKRQIQLFKEAECVYSQLQCSVADAVAVAHSDWGGSEHGGPRTRNAYAG